MGLRREDKKKRKLNELLLLDEPRSGGDCEVEFLDDLQHIKTKQ